MCDPLVIWTFNILVDIDKIFIVVPLHNPKFTSVFLNNITNALSFNSNLCNGNPLIFIEFKNSVGYKLLLKEKALVMLLKNIDVNSGLCNGTTMKIISITTKILKVQITNGSHIGDYALIPRIELSPSDSLLPFKLSRRQFPIE